MSVLNPFFRQQVQNPGMDVSVAQRPVADTTQFEDELMNEQTEAFNAMMELGVVYAKAQSQIKEDERGLALKKASNDILGDANTILQGYAQNKQFAVQGYTVDPGDKGFHSYDGFEQDKSVIESAIIDNLKTKYNPDGDQRLSELIEIQTKSALAQTFADAEKSIVRNVNDEVLTNLMMDGQQALDTLIKTGDFSQIQIVDGMIDSKQENGSITYGKALEFKRKWRKEAWTAVALNLTRAGSTNEDKAKYLQMFGNALKSKLPGKKSDQDPASKQFFQHFSITDLLNINQSVGAGAYSPEKAIQEATLFQMFAEDPLEATKLFNTTFNWTRIKSGKDKGKPNGFSMVPASGHSYEMKTVPKGKGIGTLGTLDQLMSSAETEEDRDLIKANFAGEATWPAEKRIRVRVPLTEEDHVRQIEAKLNELQLTFLDPKDVLTKLEKYGNDRLKEDQSNWVAGSFEKNKSTLYNSIQQMVEEWRLVFGDNDGFSELSIESRFDNPELPWLNEDSTAYQVWKINDERVNDLKGQVEAVHDSLKEVHSFYMDLSNGKYTKKEQASELRKRREALKQKLVDIPFLKNSNDEQSLKSIANSLHNRLLNKIYSEIYNSILNQTDTGPTPVDLERINERKKGGSEKEIHKRAVIESLKNS
tara:strand:+ start:664 stop:2607 length:1944 start_codon:yes stop_codon:yes gene_type:complete